MRVIRLTTLTPEQEAELIEGFLSRRPMAELSFVSEFRPILHAEVRIHWPGLWRHMGDLEQSALLKLCEMRESASGREAIRRGMTELAKALIDGPARALARARKTVELKPWHLKGPPNHEEVFELDRVRELAESLPRGMAATMLAHIAYLAGDGPPLHVALGIEESAARYRLIRAQAALHRLAYGEESEIQDDTDGGPDE